jgi:hypothetical protein
MSMLGLKDLPKDNPLNRVYRIGAGLLGLGLLIFGVLGYFNQLAFFDTAGGDKVAGLSTNVILSTISVVVGLALIGGAIAGGNVAAELNADIGALFLLSGLVNLTLLRTDWNILNFSMVNVIFSFVAGLVLLTFGLYGRVSGGLPPDNPFYRSRHGLDPATGEVVDAEKADTAGRRGGGASPAPRKDDDGADPRQLTSSSDAEGRPTSG